MIGETRNERRDRLRKLFRVGKKCAFCGTDKNITIDHIIPKSKGGRKGKSNWQPLCEKCNYRKANRSLRGDE